MSREAEALPAPQSRRCPELCRCDEGRMWKRPVVRAPERHLVRALVGIALISDFGFAI